jgi:hypothetical protein
MAAVENDMGAFADNLSAIFAARFPHSPVTTGGTYAIFPGLSHGRGGMLPSGLLPTGSLDVSDAIRASGWTFTGNPSQHYIDGTASFSAVNAGNGKITFRYTPGGDFAGPIFWAFQPIIKAGENSNWKNMLDNVQGFCELGWWPYGCPTCSSVVPSTIHPYGPAKSGTPASPPSSCTGRMLSAVNNQFKTEFNPADVVKNFINGGGFNLVITGTNLPNPQFNNIALGRYPTNAESALLGYGASLHVPNRGLLDPNAVFRKVGVPGQNSVTFTAHTDSAFAYNPVDALLHYWIDVRGAQTRNPCP